eukprot:CAMPEP_0170902276 /NCGR_PEP_ID=MMETSP0734-20130129/48989_1 /TAXON_ID=186038 /ORGANISM="Fragilariopsis kerguelensis, Strain L26-C5" /LENGTH=524 /DNA_ID=CAMNT_0011297069 /DNA_START=94 /DNA_END=1667 /DNA_ORIENTATION=+
MLSRLITTSKPISTGAVFTRGTGGIVVRRCRTTVTESSSTAAFTKQQQQLSSYRHRFSKSANTTTTTTKTATPTPPPAKEFRQVKYASTPKSWPKELQPKSETAAAEAFETADTVPIGASLAAAFAAVGAVMATAFVMEQSTAESCLPYSTQKGAQRFDQTTFSGRFLRIFLACDPALLFYSETQIEDAQQVLVLNASSSGSSGVDKYTSSQVSDRTLWEAQRIVDAAVHPDTQEIIPPAVPDVGLNRTLWESQRIVDAAVHPDTQEIIPRPFRMSGYVPYNGPICVAMVASTTTIPLLFFSWLNQSQNAAVNYYNRNASSPMTNETLIKSYTVAVGSALVVAFGLSTLVQKRFSPSKAKEMMKFVAFPSAVVASSLNCYVVRSPEITTGIPLMDEAGNTIRMVQDKKDNKNIVVNKSQLAAKAGVESTTLSRALLQAPVYFIPSMLMGTLPPLRNFIDKNPKHRVPITTFLVLLAFGVGLPATVAVFPQISSIDAKDVEPKYQHLLNPHTQKPYTEFYYNKGL